MTTSSLKRKRTPESMKPFYVTGNGPLQAQGKIKTCTTPKPDACKLGVELEKRLSSGLYGVVASKNTGWVSCKGALTPDFEHVYAAWTRVVAVG